MISLDKCKKILNQPDLSDETIEKIRGALYHIAEKTIDIYLDDKIENNANQ